MNEFDRFEQLAAAARAEPVPPLDVRTHVLREIRGMVTRRGIDAPLVLLSGVSVLVASIVAAMAAEVWEVLLNPLSAFFNSLTMVMQ